MCMVPFMGKGGVGSPKSERRQEQPDVGGALIYLFAVDKKVVVQGSLDGGWGNGDEWIRESGHEVRLGDIKSMRDAVWGMKHAPLLLHFLSSFALPSFRSFFYASLFVCLSLCILCMLCILCIFVTFLNIFVISLCFFLSILFVAFFFSSSLSRTLLFQSRSSALRGIHVSKFYNVQPLQSAATLCLTPLMWWHHAHHSHFSFTASCRVCNALFVHVDRILSCHDGSELACMFAQV